MKSKFSYDVIIIGAGPSGMSAALYLKRAGINILVLDGASPGGTLNKISKIENYPGYIDKEGPTLAFRMYGMLEELSVPFKTEKVINIIKKNNDYDIITSNSCYNAKYIVIASGKAPRKLNIDGFDKYVGHGISYCATCDGTLYKNKNVAIIGGGNSAFMAASYLKDIVNKLYIVNRSSILRADKKEQESVINNSNVEILYNSNIVSLMEENNKIIGIKLDNNKVLDVCGIFVCIGQELNNFYYQNLNLSSDNLGILVDKDMKTSENNIYAVGDSISKGLYQVVTAVSEGAIAATSIIKDIKRH